MKLYKARNYQELSRKAATIIGAQIIQKPDCVLGLATGSSPLGTYQELISMCKAGDLDFSEVTTVNLDEYKGLNADNDQSYRYFMNKNLFSQINIPMSSTHVPDGTEPDSDKACAAYNELLEQIGSIDLQLLGLGHNGHIGFNEPADHFPEETHCVDLTEKTIQANKRFFASEADVPRQAYTMGIGTIMHAKTVLMIVSGADKADILREVLEGPVTPMVPASILKFHPNAIIVADADALSKVTKF
jgi:glucosamine-6-phosphate deaminase